ncbi:hypothetical protein ES332_D11G257400v1 [Gossypium tomentosum]|uniref:Uncharacterized protein n=1 Tax=Gossypium tomentosum TaxID=34277 RepID=A0A5D2ISG3_GOSTO|nr:hypothetical protein ES332_D11G257400v1 [Gossypium tomentosum]
MKKQIFLPFSAKNCFWADLLLFLATQHTTTFFIAGSLFLPFLCSSSSLKKYLVLCSSSPPPHSRCVSSPPPPASLQFQYWSSPCRLISFQKTLIPHSLFLFFFYITSKAEKSKVDEEIC